MQSRGGGKIRKKRAVTWEGYCAAKSSMEKMTRKNPSERLFLWYETNGHGTPCPYSTTKHLANCAQLDQPYGATALKSFCFCTMLFLVGTRRAVSDSIRFPPPTQAFRTKFQEIRKNFWNPLHKPRKIWYNRTCVSCGCGSCLKIRYFCMGVRPAFLRFAGRTAIWTLRNKSSCS